MHIWLIIIKDIILYYHDSLDKKLKSLFRIKKYVQLQHQPNQFQKSWKPEGYNSHNNPEAVRKFHW